MSMIQDSAVDFGSVVWQTLVKTYRCRVFIIPETECGGYSAFAADLPGAASQGDTIDDAKTNIEEALTALIQSYVENGEAIPWGDAGVAKTADTIEISVMVNA